MDTVSLYSGKFKHILYACDLIQYVKQPTHIHGPIIDLFITTPEIPVSNVRIGECLTDHLSISLLIDFHVLHDSNVKVYKYREFQKINQSVFLKRILKTHHLFLHQPLIFLNFLINTSMIYHFYLINMLHLNQKK
jgi:hypothetical protein